MTTPPTTELDPLALVRQLLLNHLTPAWPRLEVRTELPRAEELDNHLPLIWLHMLPGEHTHIPWNGDRALRYAARLDFDVMATEYATASSLALQLATALPALKNQGNQWGRATGISEIYGPEDRPDFNPRVLRLGVTASITCR